MTTRYECSCGESTDNFQEIDTCRYCGQTFLTVHDTCFTKHLAEKHPYPVQNKVCPICVECKASIYSPFKMCRENDCVAVLHEQCVSYHLLHVHLNSYVDTFVSTSKDKRIKELEEKLDKLYDIFGYEIWEHDQK